MVQKSLSKHDYYWHTSVSGQFKVIGKSGRCLYFGTLWANCSIQVAQKNGAMFLAEDYHYFPLPGCPWLGLSAGCPVPALPPFGFLQDNGSLAGRGLLVINGSLALWFRAFSTALLTKLFTSSCLRTMASCKSFRRYTVGMFSSF